MNIDEYQQLAKDGKIEKPQYPIDVNGPITSESSVNIQLTPAQAVKLARRLLSKVEDLADVEDATIQLWRPKGTGQKLCLGAIRAVKSGPKE